MERLFISGAPADAAAAQAVGAILERAGYRVELPQRQIAEKTFIAGHQAALESRARIVVLLSPAALADDYCTAQWQSVLAADPDDEAGRLIVLQIAPCPVPAAFTKLGVWNLCGGDADRLERFVLQAARAERGAPTENGDVRGANAAGNGPDMRGATRARGSPLPGGTVTFLFTKIDGSAERWTQQPAAMQRALERHDEIVRTVLAAHGGYPFKTLGDGVRAAFARAEDAVEAALDVQYRIRGEDFTAVDGLPVRIAIHTGAADEHAGDYTGLVIDRAALLLEIGFGGQILLSGVTANLVRRGLPAQTELLDLGEHRLDDRLVLERIYQAVGPRLPAAFPPLRTQAAIRNNLPPELTSFVGRDTEITQITALIAEHRLVTLVGAGGIGKTRTALAVAAGSAGFAGDGVWFVDFAPLSEGRYLVAEIAAVLGVRDERGTHLLAALTAHLSGKRMLLILDNCEHVIADARDTVQAITQNCANVVILATSRELLGASDEVVYRLPTLGVPPNEETLAAADALRYEAIELFVSRARSASAKFVLSDANAGVIADICRHLDGIPLAIELAAARVAILGVADIRSRLDERFRLLKGGSRSALPRQQTLRALIDWSYDLLDADGQRLFRGLSAFAGGWTLEAATAVCGDAGTDEFIILDGLTSLADKSLVIVESSGESNRFRFLESVRVYALERARENGEVEDSARRRAVYFAEFAAYGRSISGDIVARIAAIAAELDNLREVLRWALEEEHDVELGGRVACALGRFWSTRLPREGERWLRLAQSRLPADADRSLTAEIANALAAMLPHGSIERFEATERALQANRDLGEPMKLTKALAAYGEQLQSTGRDDEAEAAFAEALEAARRVPSNWDAARALAGLTMIAVAHGDVAQARVFGRQAIELFAALRAVDGVAYVSIALADAEYQAGNMETAFGLARRARDAYGEVQNKRSIAGAANLLGALSSVAGDVDATRTHARDALEALGSDHHPMFFPEAVGLLALVATRHGDVERGALLFGYYERKRSQTLHQLGGCAKDSRDLLDQALGVALGPEARARKEAAGAQLDEARAREIALSI